MAQVQIHIIKPQQAISYREQLCIQLLLKQLHAICAQAKVSEYINLHTYTAKRLELRIRRMLGKDLDLPFEFVHCLN
jgi:hypothetical protein